MYRLHSCNHCLDLILLSKGSKSVRTPAYLPYGLAYHLHIKFEIPSAMLQKQQN